MKHMYYQFPKEPEFERKFNFKADLPYVVKVMAGMDGQFGNFITDGPDRKATPVKAKRSINIEITDKSIDFYPLNKSNLNSVLKDVAAEGIIDFKVHLKYSFLDEKFDRVPFKGDSFLVRTDLENGVLTMKVHHIEGMGRTECERVADTIVEEIARNAPNV
ncbi:MAG: hypothetical protein ABOK23_02480 [Candidatus Methanoperedens sp.]|nr:hypothetical protein [Candidatus Methanoperedens sp.]MCZ7394709.1 hypothetical protein [Candidatus Methanoperedens sp.]